MTSKVALTSRWKPGAADDRREELGVLEAGDDFGAKGDAVGEADFVAVGYRFGDWRGC